jgi:ABC-2 type transport system permease protein
MRGLWKLTLVELKVFLREPIAAFFTLVFPLMMLVLFGSIYGNEPAAMFGGRGTVDVSLPGYAGLIIGTTGLMSLTMNLAAYRERGILRRLRATPLRPAAILIAQVVTLFIMTVLGMVILIIAGKLLFNLHFSGNPLSVALAFILSSLSFFAIGFVLASVVPNARTAQVVSMAIFYPMIFLSGAGMPREILPKAIQDFSVVLPLTHVVTLLRGLWMGGSWLDYWREVVILIGILIAGLVISAKTFRWE